jgi:Mn2+/Fe2+ NRAMP family transporter
MEPFSKEQAFSTKPAAESTRRFLTVFGPGLVVMLADSDVGSVITAGQSGVQWGYRLIGLQTLLIPVLYIVQELAVRLGIFTGRGHGELVRTLLGPVWAWITLAGLAVATIGALVTELSGVAGVGELYGLPRIASLPLAALGLFAVVLTSSYRRVERVAIAIGLFELAFFFVAWAARPDIHELVSGSLDIAYGDKGYLYLAAANIGSVVTPWMIFYQQSAVADKKLLPEHYNMARCETAIGAVITQLVMCAVTVACAATLGGEHLELNSVGDLSKALTPFLGGGPGRIVFSAGILGAGMVAAIVSSLAFAWGLGEITGYRHALAEHPSRTFHTLYAAVIACTAVVVALWPNLISLNIIVQVMNALMLPIILGVLIIIAATALPEAHRPRGFYLCVVIGVCAVTAVVGLWGGLLALAG